MRKLGRKLYVYFCCQMVTAFIFPSYFINATILILGFCFNSQTNLNQNRTLEMSKYTQGKAVVSGAPLFPGLTMTKCKIGS